MWGLLYLSVGFLVGLLTMAEVMMKYPDVDLDDVILGIMAGVLGGILWPLTVIVFVIYRIGQGPWYEPNTALMCVGTGGHDWRSTGGITYRGIKAIRPNGYQGLWCIRCRAEKQVWPWGDEKFSDDETFGYTRWPDPPKGYETCACLACSHERTGMRVRRQSDGSLMVYIPMGGPTFPSMPHLVPAEKVGVCTANG